MTPRVPDAVHTVRGGSDEDLDGVPANQDGQEEGIQSYELRALDVFLLFVLSYHHSLHYNNTSPSRTEWRLAQSRWPGLQRMQRGYRGKQASGHASLGGGWEGVRTRIVGWWVGRHQDTHRGEVGGRVESMGHLQPLRMPDILSWSSQGWVSKLHGLHLNRYHSHPHITVLPSHVDVRTQVGFRWYTFALLMHRKSVYIPTYSSPRVHASGHVPDA